MAKGRQTRMRTQWIFGHWHRLIEEHVMPEQLDGLDQGREAALVGSALIQQGQLDQGRTALERARAAGVSREELLRILIAGTHNSLARCALLESKPELAASHIAEGLKVALPGDDIELLARARLAEQQRALMDRAITPLATPDPKELLR